LFSGLTGFRTKSGHTKDRANKKAEMPERIKYLSSGSSATSMKNQQSPVSRPRFTKSLALSVDLILTNRESSKTLQKTFETLLDQYSRNNITDQLHH
jgi:hypothetical protein